MKLTRRHLRKIIIESLNESFESEGGEGADPFDQWSPELQSAGFRTCIDIQKDYDGLLQYTQHASKHDIEFLDHELYRLAKEASALGCGDKFIDRYGEKMDATSGELFEAYIAGEDPSQVYKSAPAHKRAKDKSIEALGDILSDKHEAEKLFGNDPRQAQALAGSFAEFSPEEEVAIEMGKERAYDDKPIESLGPTSMDPVTQEIYHYSHGGTSNIIALKLDQKKAADVILSFLDRDVQDYLKKDITNYGTVWEMLDDHNNPARKKFLKWMKASSDLNLHMKNELKAKYPNIAAGRSWSYGDINNKILEVSLEFYSQYG